MEQGYFFDGSLILDKAETEFSSFYESSHIVRSDLYQPISKQRSYDEEYIKWALGSHRTIVGHFRQAGAPLEVLPFPRVGYRGNMSSSLNIRKWMFGRMTLMGHPVRTVRRLSRLCPMTAALEDEYFADDNKIEIWRNCCILGNFLNSSMK